MKKWLSYIFPFTKKIQSQFNGELELTLVNGKYLLDSSQTNYSYGSLQKILEKGLVDLMPLPNSPALILGLGAGCVIQSLRDKFGFSEKITAVELDPVLLDLAKDTFQVNSFSNLEIILQDAYEFMQNNYSKYGLIVVDLFIDKKVPLIFYSQEFAVLLEKGLSENGKLLMNIGFESDVNTQNLDLLAYFDKQENYELLLKSKVNGTNTLLLVQHKANERKPTQRTVATN